MRDPAPLLAALLLALGGVASGLGLAALKPGGLRLSAPAREAACESPDARAAVVPVAEAARICSQGQVLIADARPAAEYARGHVAGAVHLPCDASGKVAGEALRLFGGAGSVLVYGSSTAEAEAVARALAGRLPQRGPRVLALEGGFAAWEEAGLACASGPCDQCAVAQPQGMSR